MALVEQDMDKPPGALKNITDLLLGEYLETIDDLRNLTEEQARTIKIPLGVFTKIKARVN